MPALRPARLVALGLLVAVGCSDGVPAGGGPRTPISTDASVDGDIVCVAPEEGCDCEVGTPPVDCYLDPVFDGERTVCRHGTRYCRDSVWSGCESLTESVLPGGSSALLTGPTICNPCDPRCFGYTDRPGPGDTGGSSTITYDPSRGGLTLTTSSGGSGGLTDTDGDGVPDVADQCVGAGAILNPDGTCYTGTAFVHTLSFGGGSVLDHLPLTVQIRTADVYFLMDTTGSMGGELTRLRTDLTSGNFHPTDATCGNGVVGAIRCAIPDAWFGVGFFEDYPVDPYGGWSGVRDDIVFHNVLDITSSIPATQTAINTLTINWGNDGPEANTQALWAVASGGALGPYLSARTGCAAGRWGFPCFRDGTIPIVIHVTDAPFHNGPASAYPYAFSWGGASVTAVTANDSFATYYPIGNVPSWAIYTGTTTGMTDDVAAGCNTAGAPDSVFAFTVPAGPSLNVTLRTEGSALDTSIALYRRDITGPTAVSGNEAPASAYTISAPTATAYRFTGSTAAMANDLGSGYCGSTTAPDAMYRFTLPATTTVAIDTVGSAYDTVLTLWGEAAPTAVTGNESITSSPRDVGTITSTSTASFSGSTAAMAHDHSAATCGSVVAPDAAFRFQLASSQTITIDTIGSAYNTVLSLYGRSGTAVTGNDLFGAEHSATAAIGTNTSFSGDTSFMSNEVSSACGGAGADALYAFTLGSTATLDVDTLGSGFDTVLSLYTYTPVAAAVAVTGNDTVATARDLGTLGAGYHAQFTGNTSAVTDNFISSCARTSFSASPDVYFRFTLATARRVTLDLSGSDFNTTVTLMNSAGTSEITCDDTSGAGDDGRLIINTLAAGTYYVLVEGYRGSHVGNYNLRVAADELTEVACDDNGGGGTASSINRSLAAGTYLLAVDGRTSTDEGTYLLNFGTGGYNQIACDNDGVTAMGASRIVQTLAPGEYFAVVDGYGSASGAYQINFGGSGGLSYANCNDDAVGLGTQSRIVQSLPAGTYYIGVDGYGSASGSYVLNFQGSSAATFIACNDDGPAAPASELMQTLPPGEYFAVVDGRGSAAGAYRLAIGTTPMAVTFPAPVTWDDTITALTARNVRVITLQTCGSWGNSYCLEGESHAHSLSYATDSVDGTGSPYTFRGAADGSGLSSAIVNAVVNLANYSRMDITARPSGDTQGFTVLPISAVSWGPGGNCQSISGGTFVGCTPGTQVNFDVQFRNDVVMPTAVPQVFDFYIEVVGDGTIVLARVPVRITVPPTVTMFAPSGTYTRDYDSTIRCALNERPIWGTLGWDVPSLPAGTSVRFELSTADTAAALPTATPIATVNVASMGTGTTSITNALNAAGILPRLYFLRVNAVLNASADLMSAPVLRQVDVSYTCIPDE